MRSTIPPTPMKTRLEILELCFETHQEITCKELTKLIKEKFDRFGYLYYQYLWKRNYLQYDYDGLAMLGAKGGPLLVEYRKNYGKSFEKQIKRTET